MLMKILETCKQCEEVTPTLVPGDERNERLDFEVEECLECADLHARRDVAEMAL